MEEDRKIPTFRLDPAIEKAQTERLRQLRTGRDGKRVTERLERLEEAARGQENLMPLILDAAAVYATLGEISDRLRAVFGEYCEAA
jgi:methylmalonyl-CoA mutase N-terminal domain/subunit